MNGALWVLLLSGILGFRVGLLGFPDWQVAVETAQVVARLVQYPPDNIFYIYHTKLWTSLHHMLALGLLAGVNELTLSLVVSGVLGMLTFQALAMFVYALSRHVLLSVGAAALVFFTRTAEYGVVYPLFLVGTEHTYGVVGLSLSVLIAGILGAGWYRTGAIVLGLAPSIHPSLGVWTGSIVALAILSDFRRLRDELRPALPWFLAGCGLTLVSLLIQFTLVYKSPQGMARLSPHDLATFVRLWDGHRAAINVWHDGVLLNAAALVVAFLWLTFFSGDLPRPSQFLLRISAAASLLALALIPGFLDSARPVADRSARVDAGALPELLGNDLRRDVDRARGQPSRSLEPSRAVLPDVRPAGWRSQHAVGISRASSSRSVSEQHSAAAHCLDRNCGTPCECGLGAVGATVRLTVRLTGSAVGGHYRVGYALQIAVLALVVLMTMHQHQDRSGAHFSDRTNDVFFADVAAGSGVLVVAGDLHLIQLRTRRPVLVDSGALDTVMYSLETGAAMQRILSDVYGLDLFNPPPEAVGSGRIPPLAHRRAWESYSPEKWRSIRRTFGVTQVIAYADWSLQLPLASQSRRLLLYDIPER